MYLKLICDNRERAVTSLINMEDNETIATAQLTTGDYATVYYDDETPEGVILEIFERKTLSDYAASFRDGRHENKNKLLALRNLTDCLIYYIVEGPAAEPGDKFCGIKYSGIEASIFNMNTNHGIFVIRTADAEDTARVLHAKQLALMRSIESDKFIVPCAPLGQDNISMNAMSLLTQAPVVTVDSIVMACLETISGISAKSSEAICKSISLIDILFNNDLETKLNAIRIQGTPGTPGRRLSGTVIKTLLSLGDEDKSKIIAEFPRATIASVSEWSYEGVWDLSAEKFTKKLHTLSFGKSKVGLKRAERFIKYLEYTSD